MKKIQTCNCGCIEGKNILLNSHAHVGITTEFQDNGVFHNNKALYIENNYCPQCGKKYNVVFEKDEQEELPI
ncbi:hypothetical protein [Vallitalea guaymasensis]|uniref:hypothetical protein n=1 Tax=Vallitalea guaymasensis TaxID=1185412 RepID=UPI002357ACE4|nr:hypothetical protein [Vallitalea guaymasensis]